MSVSALSADPHRLTAAGREILEQVGAGLEFFSGMCDGLLGR
jgi:hypothetical protein